MEAEFQESSNSELPPPPPGLPAQYINPADVEVLTQKPTVRGARGENNRDNEQVGYAGRGKGIRHRLEWFKFWIKYFR